MDMRTCAAAGALIGGLLCATLGAAQFPQYTAPGSLAVPQTPTRERIEASSRSARWDLGALRVDPRLWIRDMGYNDNVFGAPEGSPKISDFSASAGAGLVGFSNLGPDLLLSVYLLPEYSWWQDLEQLREQHLNYGVGLFGFYNRLTLVVELRRDEGQRLLTSESLSPFDIRQNRAAVQASVDLHGPFEVFGSVEIRDFEHTRGGPEVARLAPEALDREERIGRLGVAYEFPSELRVGLGFEHSEADFRIDPAGRSNTTRGPLIEVSYDEDPFQVIGVLVLREVEFDGAVDSSRTELTGSVRAGRRAGHRVRIDAYGGRSLVYSVVGADRFFTEDRMGLSVGTPWGRRFHTRVFGEAGTDDYDRVAAAGDERRDDVTAVGAELELELSENLLFSVSATQTDYDSNQPGADRSIGILRVGLRLGGDPRPW